MKYIFTSLLLFLGLSISAQEFYDLNNIQTIEITFSQSNWDQLLDDEKQGDENYILAESLSINGTVFDSVGVKYKGNSTYNPNQTKNPFHIELDTYKDHEYDGYTDIKLSNVAKDPSFLREVLSYKVLRNYMDAPLSNYANVYVNGNLIGLYSNSEAVSKKFVNSRFYSKDNTFVKCNPPAGAGPGSSDLPNLVYLGTDSVNYYDAYELKSEFGWNELIDLCDTLKNEIEFIENTIDIDRVIWMHAFNNALVNLDSYSGGFTQNYYLYKDDNGRFVPVVWDLNESFGKFAMAGSGPPLNNTTAKQQLDYLLHDNEADFPLISQVLSIPQYKRMYIAHFKTIMEENFSDDSYYTESLELQTLIDDAVQADNNKFFSYANFQDNLVSDITGGGPMGSTPGITNLMDGRYNYIMSQSDFTATAPSISNINQSNPEPIIGESIFVTAEIDNTTEVLLGYRDNIKDVFTKIEMFDDGNHGDGAANDGTFGVELEITNFYMQFFIYADNNEAGKFSPQRAEHEYHELTAKITNPQIGDLVINEFMASNGSTESDSDGEFDDWIELYNNNTEDILLDGYFLSDDGDDLNQWEFPAGTVISGNSYLIIWADKDEEQDGLHCNFKLSKEADVIILVNNANEIIDEYSYTNQVEDISFGRFPNGIGNFQQMNPTFNAENSGVIDGVFEQESISFNVFPNPAFEMITVEMDKNSPETPIYIFDIHSRIQYQSKINQNTQIDCSSWASGIYFVRINQQVRKIIVHER